MASVDVTVAGRAYTLACENGQERHLAQLAAMVDAEARKLAAQIGPTSEGKLMLMAALMIADRLSEAGEALKTARAAPSPSGPDLFGEADGGALGAAMERLEQLVAAHEQPTRR